MNKFLILMLNPFIGLAQDAPFKITGNIGKQGQPCPGIPYLQDGRRVC